MFDSHMSFKIHPKKGVWLWECGLASLAKKRLDIYRLGLTLMFHAIFGTGGMDSFGKKVRIHLIYF